MRNLIGGNEHQHAYFVVTDRRRDHGEPMIADFVLHPQLAQDTVPVGDLALTRVLLANDANYPWLMLVPRRAGLVQLIELEENSQGQLLGEVPNAAPALKTISECDKLNVAAL